MRKILIGLLLLSLLLGSLSFASAQEGSETPERDSVAVTIYNQGTALIKDRRTFTFNAGENLINFSDVASSIDPTSVNFLSITDPLGTRVLEQNYVFDLVGAYALLQRYVDENIRVTTTDGTLYEGRLLSGTGEIILQSNDGGVIVISQTEVRDIQFPSLPEGLITRPTLRWLINSETGGEQQVELTYLTTGINWSADYNVLLNADNSALDLNGWVTINNTSGTAYPDALVKLVAGDVNRVAPAPAMDRDMVFEEAMAQTAEANVAQREFFEYQLYEISRSVSIGNNETKQVEFVTGANVPASTFFVYDGSYPFYGYGGFNSDQFYGQMGITDVQNFLEFSTDEDGGLGADMPAGRIRVYQEDADGAALLIGENYVDHTPEGEEVEIYLGNAFDLVGERVQTDFQLIGTNVIEETYEIHLRNNKEEETVQIRVPERLTRWANWEILESSMPYEQLNAYTIEFRADVAPESEVIISYTVRYTFR
jgi:hypothetical protein